MKLQKPNFTMIYCNISKEIAECSAIPTSNRRKRYVRNTCKYFTPEKNKMHFEDNKRSLISLYPGIVISPS